jgi:hypothetical protein
MLALYKLEKARRRKRNKATSLYSLLHPFVSMIWNRRENMQQISPTH